jgi:multicomponent Na+:H+ antiporter subunit E
MTDEAPSNGVTVSADVAQEAGWRPRELAKNPLLLRRFVVAAVSIFVIWLLLVASFDPAEWVAGLLVTGLTALVSGPHLQILDGIKLRPALPWHILRYLAVFLGALVTANLDMARRVLSPALPIRPGMVEVRTRLRSPLGKLLLANSITLTPGTLSVDVLDDRIQVHWIDVGPGADVEQATSLIVARFERRLQVFLE